MEEVARANAAAPPGALYRRFPVTMAGCDHKKVRWKCGEKRLFAGRFKKRFRTSQPLREARLGFVSHRMHPITSPAAPQIMRRAYSLYLYF